MNEAMSEFMGTSEEIRLTVANAGQISIYNFVDYWKNVTFCTRVIHMNNGYIAEWYKMQ